jgi:hypothetical protein
MDVIQRNLLKLIRSGAFSEAVSLERMSEYKWRRLYDIVEREGLSEWFIRGANSHRKDEDLNIPDHLIQEFRARMAAPIALPDKRQSTKLCSPGGKSRFNTIIASDEAEEHSETSEMFRLIVSNATDYLSYGIRLKSIIELGKAIRQDNGDVDYALLKKWLRQIGLTGMADLQGSLLVDALNFMPEDVPFMVRKRKDVLSLLFQSMADLEADLSSTLLESPFQADNFPARSLRYRRFSSLESYSHYAACVANRISNVEE